jgi:hypothetical protein
LGLASLESDIAERRIQNEARILFEYQYPQGYADLDSGGDDPELVATAQSLGMTPARLIDLRQWVQRMTKECNERLSREKTLVYTVNESRTQVLAVQLMSKHDAAKMTKVVSGELLDLDSVYGGMLICDGYAFVSEQTVMGRLREYDHPVALLNALIEELRAA